MDILIIITNNTCTYILFLLLLFHPVLYALSTSSSLIRRTNNNSIRSSSTSSSFSITTSSSSSLWTFKNKKNVIIIGGGPIGLCTAYTLANPPFSYSVDIYESSMDGGITYDPSKSFVYNINPRGQELFTTFHPEIENKLHQVGISQLKGFIIIPSNPTQAISTKPQSMNINTKKKNVGKKKKNIQQEEEKEKISYWIPRHDFVLLLRQAIEKQNNEIETINQKEGGQVIKKGRIRIHDGIVFHDLQFINNYKEDNNNNDANNMYEEENTQIVVTLKYNSLDERNNNNSSSSSNKNKNILWNQTTSLLIGADGVNSMVRQCLNQQPHLNKMYIDSYHNVDKFKVKQWTTPSTGLRLKALQLPANFTIPQPDGTLYQTTGDTVFAIRSKFTSPRTYLSLGMLPNNRNDGYRPANCITRDNHEIWQLHDGESLQAWFEKAFPRMPFKKEDTLVPPSEWDRLAKATGIRFPPCQYSPGLSVTSLDETCGIALVGDAVHAFPPDIGQGVNAGLGDVLALRQALIANIEDFSMGKALKEYERNRSPEIKALIRLARFGSPYQYRQPDYMSKIGRVLWSWNVLLRLILNKVTFGVFPNQSILLAQDESLSFRQVMRKADGATVALLMILCGVLFKVSKKLF